MSDDQDDEEAPLDDLHREVAARREKTQDTTADAEESAEQTKEGEEPGGHRETDGDRSLDSGSEDIPLEGLREAVASRTDPEATPAAGTDIEDREGLFTEMDSDDVDSEDVWADLLLEDGPTEGSFPPIATEWGEDVTYQIVPKRLCHRCEFFGDPPTLHCTHEGTTIHELTDMEHYRVSSCPMVDADDTEHSS